MVDDIADRNVNEAALRHAAMHGMLEEVTRLIAAGTNVDATDEYDGWTASMFAVCNGNAEILRVLLTAGADINLQNNRGWTLLVYAACYGHVEAVRVLLAAGADIDLPDNEGRTPLMGPALRAHVETVLILLAAGADINHQNEIGWTALMCAAEGKEASIQDAIVDVHLAQIRAAMHESISSVPSADHQRQPQQHAIQPNLGNLRRSLVITELPEDIYRCIQAFTSINVLLNTSSRMTDVKRRLYFWNLTRQYSLLYYLSAEYRQLLASNGRLLHDSRKQVGLDLRLSAGPLQINLSEDVVNELRGAVLRIHLPT